MKRLLTTISAVATLVVMAGSVQAAGFHTGEYYTAYTGQATAGLTLLENAGLMSTLPSGMVRLDEGIHALGSLTLFTPKVEYSTLDGSESGSNEKETTLGPHAFGVYNQGDWAVGMGMYFPFNVSIKYPKDWAGRSDLIEESLFVGYQALSGAYAINEEMSVGGSINFIGAWVQLKLIENATGGIEIPVEFGGTANEIGYNVSFLYDDGIWAAGMTYNPGYTLHGEGNVKFDTSQAPGLTGSLPDGGIKLDLNMPSLTEIGVSHRDNSEDPTHMIEFSVLHTGWSTYKELRIRYDNNFPEEDSVVKKNWKDTLGFKVGGNYVVARDGDTKHLVRGGLYIDQSPVPADTLDAAVADSEGRTTIAFGYGLHMGELKVDFAYMLSDWKPSKTTADTDNLPAEYDAKVDIYSASVGYKW